MTSKRLHSALLDAQLLAGGQRQVDLGFDLEAASGPAVAITAMQIARPLLPLRVRRADADERAAHRRRIDALQRAGRCLWPVELDREDVHADSTAVMA